MTLARTALAFILAADAVLVWRDWMRARPLDRSALAAMACALAAAAGAIWLNLNLN
jgi:hypothetical protein